MVGNIRLGEIARWHRLTNDQVRLDLASIPHQLIPTGEVFVGDEHARSLYRVRCRGCGEPGQPLYANGRCEDCNDGPSVQPVRVD